MTKIRTFFLTPVDSLPQRLRSNLVEKKLDILKTRIPRVCYNRKEKSGCTFPLILNLGNDAGRLHVPVASPGIKSSR